MSVLRKIAVFLCGFLLFRLSRAQIILPGQCPDIKAMSDFNPTRYLGTWYEAEKYFFIFEFGARCITANYVSRDNGAVGVINKQIGILSGVQSEIRGEANQVSRSGEAKLSVRFPTLPVDIPAPYWVIDTDYDSYALVWSCNNIKFFHTLNSWILTRERNPPQSVLDKAYDAADKYGIDRTYFLKTDQSNCPNYDD